MALFDHEQARSKLAALIAADDEDRVKDMSDKAGGNFPPDAGVTADCDAATPVDDEDESLELVSTQMLKRILTTRDDSERRAIRAAVDSNSEGVLARSPRSGSFAIIDDDELQAILDTFDTPPKVRRPSDAIREPLRDYPEDDQLSLVSSHALRKVLHDADDEAEETTATEFDPYARG